MEEQVQISFRLVTIKNEKNHINISEAIQKELDPETLRFQFKVNVELNLTDETITVIPMVRYKCKETEILNSESTFIYNVPGLKANTSFSSETGEIKQKADIIPTLVSASFSSLRGIIYLAAKGTPIQGYPVPLVGMDNLISKIGISVIE